MPTTKLFSKDNEYNAPAENVNNTNQSEGGPAFPIDYLPPVFQEMVKTTSSVMGVPDVLPGVAALAVVAASLGKGLRITSGQGRFTFGNIFTLVSAASGTGKSTAMREMLQPLRWIEDYLTEFAGCNDVTQPCEPHDQNQELVSAGNSPVKNRGRKRNNRHRSKKQESAPQRLICENITAPALAQFIVANKEKAFNVSAEAGNLLDEAGKSASPLGLMLLKGFSGDPLEIHRVTRDPIHLEEPCISLLWFCQPHRLDSFLSSKRLLEDGLLARFLVAHSGAEMPMLDHEEKHIPIFVRDSYGAAVNALFQQYFLNSEEPNTVETSQEGFEVLKGFHNECADMWRNDYQTIQSCTARWPEQAWKIALVLHAANHGADAHNHPLSAGTASRAVEIVRWFAAQQVSVLGLSTRKRSVDRAEQLFTLLNAAPNKEMTTRDLKNSHGFDDSEIDRLVKQSPVKLKSTKRQNPKGGRPSQVICLITS